MAIGDLSIPYGDGSDFRAGCTLFENKTKPIVVQFDNLFEKKEITRVDFGAWLG